MARIIWIAVVQRAVNAKRSWVNRTMVFRALKGLTDHISVSVVHPDMLTQGWTFQTDYPSATGDALFGMTHARDIYLKAHPDVTTRATVPILWAYTRELYQWRGVRDTVNFDHIVRHYHYSHETINPHRIIPINPILDCNAPHGRRALQAA